MIDWFKAWSKEIIITVIIATIVEIILPNSNTKKYVKIASGLIIMYTVMYPIFGKLLDKHNSGVLLSSSKNKAIQCFSSEYNDVSYSSNNVINSIYINNLRKDISSRLSNMGYECGEINVLVDEESYDIKEIQVEIKRKDTSKKKAYSIVKTIEHVCISISKEAEDENSVIDSGDMMDITTFLSETYGVCMENIEVR